MEKISFYENKSKKSVYNKVYLLKKTPAFLYKKYDFMFEINHNGDLPFDTVYVGINNDSIFDKYKKREIAFSLGGEPFYVSDYGSEYCMTKHDYTNNKVSINVMKVVNHAIKNIMEDIYSSIPLKNSKFDDIEDYIKIGERNE